MLPRPLSNFELGDPELLRNRPPCSSTDDQLPSPFSGPAQRYYKSMYHATARQMPPGWHAKNTAKVVRSNWRALSAEEKQPYVDATDRDKAQHLLLVTTMVSTGVHYTGCWLSDTGLVRQQLISMKREACQALKDSQL